MMSSIIDNHHEIIDILKKEGWTFEEVIKSVYYYWKYIDVKDYTWRINPNNLIDLIDHLRNTSINYDTSYVSICQNDDEEKVVIEITMKSMVGKNNAKMMYSPTIWKIQKNIKGYYQLAMKLLHNKRYYGLNLYEMLEDCIINCNYYFIGDFDSNSSRRFAPKHIRFALDKEYDTSFLEKELQIYINVLTMFKVYDCTDIKSIYNLGNNNSFIIEINNDTHDQIMHIQLKDRTINELVSNGKHIHSNNYYDDNSNLIDSSNSNSYQIHKLLLNDTTKALLNIGVKSLSELKRITIINNNQFTLILENGSMYNVNRGKHNITVIEFISSFNNSDSDD